MDFINENSKKVFMSSFDIENDEMIQFLPYLLKDIWEFGSIPLYKYELLNKKMLTNGNPSIINLGCGKGAEIIQLAEKFKFNGIGIDIVPEFIEDADFRKRLNHCEHLQFVVDDFMQNLSKYSNYDILIFRYDAEYFGDITDTLSMLKKVIKKNSGHILLDNAFVNYGSKLEDNKSYDTYPNLKTKILSSGFDIISRIYWDKRIVDRIYNFYNMCIARRVEELMDKYPDKKELFNSYTNRQNEESELLKNELTCITWLLKIK